MNILVTGANGFVGRAFVKKVLFDGHFVRGAVRSHQHILPTHADMTVIENINSETQWSASLDSIEIVVHLAAVTHQDAKLGDSKVFQSVNIDGTRKLLNDVIKSGVKKFIYVSSIKVYGESVKNGHILTEKSTVGVGCDLYGCSKLAAEKLVIEHCEKNSIDFVIIRPPLIYGPKVKANFRALMGLLKIGVPLPFANINNKRSMIFIDNIVDFIQLCCVNEQANNEIFLVSDNQDLSLPHLIRLIKHSMNKQPLLFPFPLVLLKIAATILGKAQSLDKMTSSLRLSPSKAIELLKWSPTCSVENAIKTTTHDFLGLNE